MLAITALSIYVALQGPNTFLSLFFFFLTEKQAKATITGTSAKCETGRNNDRLSRCSASYFFFPFVIFLVSLMFDIKDVETVFPDAVYSVIINLLCKTTAFGVKSDTKGPSLDL